MIDNSVFVQSDIRKTKHFGTCLKNLFSSSMFNHFAKFSPLLVGHPGHGILSITCKANTSTYLISIEICFLQSGVGKTDSMVGYQRTGTQGQCLNYNRGDSYHSGGIEQLHNKLQHVLLGKLMPK